MATDALAALSTTSLPLNLVPSRMASIESPSNVASASKAAIWLASSISALSSAMASSLILCAKLATSKRTDSPACA